MIKFAQERKSKWYWPAGGSPIWWIPAVLGGFIGIPFTMPAESTWSKLNLIWAIPMFVVGVYKAWDFCCPWEGDDRE